MSQLTSLWHYVNSSPNFVPSVVGIAAAFAGSWGAQIAILRRERRREIIASVNSVNEAQALCFTIANSFMSLKNQHLIGMLQRFRATEARFEAFSNEKQVRNDYGDLVNVFEFQAELHTLPIIKVPIERLETTIFEKLGLGSRPLALTIELARAIDAVNTSTSGRNEIVTKWYEAPQVSHDAMLVRYLGVKVRGGADEKYKQTLFAIETYCNDCIFFAKLLSETLNEHGNRFRRRYRHHIFWRLPKVAKADFSSPQAQSLVPDSSGYQAWLDGFKAHPTVGQRITGFFSRKKKAA
ncbi:MAG: hypothetical protein EOR97_05290 [Mesorhizobium sp.]|uniref:hypothetical protein n=1 Tax=Mesorhizobium sp. TaxID=1871066 RepID=UPI000FE9A4E1|nr:hypothetical protein [Mesorhizobium sp.]RWN34171.1 MAG: hypothetical protein EOR97_05290 [Mesorhizobium sp.]